MIGSDEHEWYRGPQETGPISEAQIEEWGGHESDVLRLVAFEHGDVGWAAYEERRTYPGGRRSTFRRTMVLVLENNAWKVVQSHFSAPVPNIETAGVELTRTLSDLVHSADIRTPDGTETGTTTLMFTDMVDSTPLSVSLGENAWHEMVNDHFATLKGVVEREGGSVVKTLGDGGMYAFGSGSAALRAAAGIQRLLKERSDPAVQVRIGVHTGDAMRADDDYIGSTVAMAARVAAAAGGGQVLVSATTAGLVNPTEFEFGPPITVELKGLDGTHQLRLLSWQ